jgi:hypothetical protein
MDRSNRVFGGPARFDEMYPDLQDAVVDYKQYMHGSLAEQGTDFPEHHSIRTEGGVIQCTNKACTGGGFEVDAIIVDARRSPGGVKDGKLLCAGREKMGGGQTRLCGSRMRHRIRTIQKETGMFSVYNIEIKPDDEEPTLFVMSATPITGGDPLVTKPRRWEQHRTALKGHACVEETVLSEVDVELERRGTATVNNLPLSSDTMEKMSFGS